MRDLVFSHSTCFQQTIPTIVPQNNRKGKQINVILAFNMIFAPFIDIGKKWKHEHCVFVVLFYWDMDTQQVIFNNNSWPEAFYVISPYFIHNYCIKQLVRRLVSFGWLKMVHSQDWRHSYTLAKIFSQKF